MLVIRKAQMHALAEPHLRDFERRLLAHCRHTIDPQGLVFGDAELAAQVKAGLAAGLKYFATERDIARYCEIVLLMLGGWDGGHPPEAREILASNSLPAAVRLGNFERWAASQKGRDGGAV